MATKQQTQKFKKELLQEKNELCNRIQNDEQSVLDKSQTESVGELSSYDNHPAQSRDRIIRDGTESSTR